MRTLDNKRLARGGKNLQRVGEEQDIEGNECHGGGAAGRDTKGEASRPQGPAQKKKMKEFKKGLKKRDLT